MRILSYIENDNLASAAAVATVLLVVSLVVIVALDVDPATGGPPWLSRARAHRESARESPYRRAAGRPCTPVRAASIVIAYLVLLVAWPVSLVVTNTFADGFDGARRALDDPDVTSRCGSRSSRSSPWSINTVFGVGMSLLLVRYEFPGKRLLSALIDLPLRSRRSWSACRSCSSTAAATAGSGRPSRITASRSSSPPRASSWPPRSCRCRSWSARSCRCSRRSASTRSRPRAASAPTPSRRSGASPCRPSGGPSSTASCSASPARSASSAP